MALVLSVLTIGLVWTGVLELRRGIDLVDLFAIPFALLLLGSFWWRGVLAHPQVVILHPDETLEFKAPLRTRTVPVGDLQAISRVLGYIVFRYPGGEIEILENFAGFPELVATISSRNPSVKLRGC